MPQRRKEERRQDHSSLGSVLVLAILLLSGSCAAKDTATISAGSEHTCVVTSQASVKVGQPEEQTDPG